jgi:hypothetical protein
MLKRMIENYLSRLNFTNIVWEYGREGYYILAQDPHIGIRCFSVNDLVDEMLRNDI